MHDLLLAKLNNTLYSISRGSTKAEVPLARAHLTSVMGGFPLISIVVNGIFVNTVLRISVRISGTYFIHIIYHSWHFFQKNPLNIGHAFSGNLKL